MAKMWPVKEIAQKSGIDLTLVYRKYGIKLTEYADACGVRYQNLSFLIKYLIVKLAEVEVEEGRQTA